MRISVVMICKDEAENLRMSLPALHWCDDIVLVDDNSTDETEAVALSFGARVIKRKFDGFGTQKQFAVSQARHEWVLNLDADEVMTDELIAEISGLNEASAYSAYTVPVRHVFMGRVFTHGKESAYPHLRLFDRRRGNFDDAPVHEKVLTDGRTGALRFLILHHSYRNLEHYFRKFNTYTQAGARRLHEKGRSRPLLLCLAGFPFYFLKHWLIYLNILNGPQGLIWSYLNAWYHTVKYLKLYEMNRKAWRN